MTSVAGLLHFFFIYFFYFSFFLLLGGGGVPSPHFLFRGTSAWALFLPQETRASSALRILSRQSDWILVTPLLVGGHQGGDPAPTQRR